MSGGARNLSASSIVTTSTRCACATLPKFILPSAMARTQAAAGPIRAASRHLPARRPGRLAVELSDLRGATTVVARTLVDLLSA